VYDDVFKKAIERKAIGGVVAGNKSAKKSTKLVAVFEPGALEKVFADARAVNAFGSSCGARIPDNPGIVELIKTKTI
jgi:tRNA A37 threonylcarbamoyladenosine synthetase subunit TsaC/SUA5/YrdC